MSSESSSSFRHGRLLLLVGVLLIAVNLRVPFTAVAPVLGMIRESFGFSSVEAGILTATPLLVFAFTSPLVPFIARAAGLERTLFGGLLLIFSGALLRSSGSVAALFIGTGLIGVGIAMGNVLLPSLLKRDFQERITALTITYALIMSVVAAAGSALVIPLAHSSGLGWPFSLALMGSFALVSALVWLPQLRRRAPEGSSVRAAGGSLFRSRGRGERGIWRYALAWQVTLFLGINCFLYYIVISWLPVILGDAGYTAAEAGSLHGLLQMASGLAGLVLAPLIGRGKDQRLLAVGMASCVFVGLLGLLIAPHWGTLWSLVFGLGGGAVFILALAFIGLRVTTPQQAAALSGMAQSIGYLLASFGPALIGQMHDRSGNWRSGLLFCAACSLVMAVFGWFAGRSARIADPSAEAIREACSSAE